jgi:hypothetical protein
LEKAVTVKQKPSRFIKPGRFKLRKDSQKMQGKNHISVDGRFLWQRLFDCAVILSDVLAVTVFAVLNKLFKPFKINTKHIAKGQLAKYMYQFLIVTTYNFNITKQWI